MRQAYLSTDPDRTVRVRVAGGAAWLTIKGRSLGPVRAEYEYPIPVEDAQSMIQDLSPTPAIDKLRYRVWYQDQLWEIDEFKGENTGLVVAEIELDSVDQTIHRPVWLGQEVTDDPRYTNARLTQCPFSRWPEQATSPGQ